MDKLRLKFDNWRRFCVQTRTTESGLRLRRGGGSNKVLTVSRRTTKGMVLDAEKVGSNSQISGIERVNEIDHDEQAQDIMVDAISRQANHVSWDCREKSGGVDCLILYIPSGISRY